MAKKKNHVHYIVFAFATVLFWRGMWHLMDKIPVINDYFISDIISASKSLSL